MSKVIWADSNHLKKNDEWKVATVIDEVVDFCFNNEIPIVSIGTRLVHIKLIDTLCSVGVDPIIHIHHDHHAFHLYDVYG